MTSDKFSDSLNALLEQGRLRYAIDTLRDKCLGSLGQHPGLGSVISSLERTGDTYSHLRRFMMEGNPDPRRGEIYASIIEEIKEQARRFLFIVNEDRLDPFFAEYRLQKVRRTSMAQLAEELEKNGFRITMASETEADPTPFLKKREELVDEIFRKVWSLPPGASEDHKAIGKLLENEDFIVKSQIISALLLGLLKFNDPAKLELLLTAYEGAKEERLAARALTAIVIVLGRWGRSAISTPSLRHGIRELEDSLLTYSRVRDIVMTLIRTRDTDRVSREIDEAFRATMREITPEILEKLQREGLTSDSADTGMNPEWEKLMQNKDLEDKMKAINDMQMEGMDVMMQTFSRLKTFPFFRGVSGWFVPFTPDNTAVCDLFKTFNYEGFKAMADATDMCASDRFSFSLGLMQMPEERRNMLAMHIGSQLETLRDYMKDRHNTGRKPEFASEALLFARDLYRFAKLYPKHKDFYDPFEEPIDFLKVPLLGTLLDGDDIIMTSADFYFRHGYFDQALSLFLKGAKNVEDSSALRSLYEKIGYSCQMTGDYASALTNYEKADLFSSEADPSSTWLIKKLAFCNKALGNYRKSAEYYSRLLERNPDELKLEFHLGSVLLKAGDMKRGKELISKVHYLDPRHRMAERICTRLKGHEAFLEGRMTDAAKLYEKARGEQDKPSYRKDLAEELKSIEADADISMLKILLDD